MLCLWRYFAPQMTLKSVTSGRGLPQTLIELSFFVSRATNARVQFETYTSHTTKISTIPLYLSSSNHSPPAPCNTSSSRCIRHRTRHKPGVVSVCLTIYRKHISLLYRYRKDEKTNADRDLLHNPYSFFISLVASIENGWVTVL